MRGYAIAPFAKQKGREQATRAGYARGGREIARNRRQLPSRPPHSNANSQSSAKRQRPSFRRKPALQRTERPSRGEGQRETPANWPRIHHTRGHAIAPFAPRKGREQAKRCERGMHGVGPGGRSQPSTASLTPSHSNPNSKSSAKRQPTVIPAKAGIQRGGASAVHAEFYRRVIAPNGYAKNPL